MTTALLRRQVRGVERGYVQGIVAILPLLFFYWWIDPRYVSDSDLATINLVFSLYFIAVLSWVGYKVLRAMPESIWTPVPWFPIQSAVFYGFGPLVFILGNDITRALIEDSYLAVQPQELFRTYQLSISGITACLVGIILGLRLLRRPFVRPVAQVRPVVSEVKLGFALLIFGGLLRYLLIYPAQWGQIQMVLAGVISNLGSVMDLGMAILAYCAARGNRSPAIRFALFVVFPIHVAASFLSLAKAETLIVLLLPTIGAFLGNGNIRRLVTRLVVIALVFGFSQDFVHYGRGVIFDRTGNIYEAGYAERIEIVADYFTAPDTPISPYYFEERQGWWTRLTYAGPQVRAMALYDAGFVSETLSQAWVYFIPRAIWPEKPILHGPGLDLYRLLTGREEGWSFLGLSIYGDFYWQFGWPGVFIGCFLFGGVLSGVSVVSVRIVRRREFLLLPFVVSALELALHAPNSFVITGIIGPLPIMFFYYVFISGLLTLLRGRRDSAPAPAPAGAAPGYR